MHTQRRVDSLYISYTPCDNSFIFFLRQLGVYPFIRFSKRSLRLPGVGPCPEGKHTLSNLEALSVQAWVVRVEN